MALRSPEDRRLPGARAGRARRSRHAPDPLSNDPIQDLPIDRVWTGRSRVAIQGRRWFGSRCRCTSSAPWSWGVLRGTQSPPASRRRVGAPQGSRCVITNSAAASGYASWNASSANMWVGDFSCQGRRAAPLQQLQHSAMPRVGRRHVAVEQPPDVRGHVGERGERLTAERHLHDAKALGRVRGRARAVGLPATQRSHGGVLGEEALELGGRSAGRARPASRASFESTNQCFDTTNERGDSAWTRRRGPRATAGSSASCGSTWCPSPPWRSSAASASPTRSSRACPS